MRRVRLARFTLEDHRKPASENDCFAVYDVAPLTVFLFRVINRIDVFLVSDNVRFLRHFQNKKLPSDVKTDSGEVSDDDDEQEDTLVMNGDCKLVRQNSKQGSIKRQIGKVGSYMKSLLSLQEKSLFNYTR